MSAGHLGQMMTSGCCHHNIAADAKWSTASACNPCARKNATSFLTIACCTYLPLTDTSCHVWQKQVSAAIYKDMSAVHFFLRIVYLSP